MVCNQLLIFRYSFDMVCFLQILEAAGLGVQWRRLNNINEANTVLSSSILLNDHWLIIVNLANRHTSRLWVQIRGVTRYGTSLYTGNSRHNFCWLSNLSLLLQPLSTWFLKSVKFRGKRSLLTISRDWLRSLASSWEDNWFILVHFLEHTVFATAGQHRERWHVLQSLTLLRRIVKGHVRICFEISWHFETSQVRFAWAIVISALLDRCLKHFGQFRWCSLPSLSKFY